MQLPIFNLEELLLKIFNEKFNNVSLSCRSEKLQNEFTILYNSIKKIVYDVKPEDKEIFVKMFEDNINNLYKKCIIEQYGIFEDLLL